jgi:hypothetical protein
VKTEAQTATEKKTEQLKALGRKNAGDPKQG